MRIFKKTLITGFFIFSIISSINAASFFSGYTGGKLNFMANSDENSSEYDPDLTLDAFFQGQFNFSEHMWSHIEFSIDTGDMLNESIFKGTQSSFQIDELSLILNSQIEACSNYFSIYMGTFDPVGSDIFLQRYFGVQALASKITDSWLGLSGSILYPHFGVGLSDIIRFYNAPIAAGGYLYVNHEDDKYYVINTDFRFACTFRYFTLDFAAGIGAPAITNDSDYSIAFSELYWHIGTTMLFGNNLTHSLFLQAGLYNAPFNPKKNTLNFSSEDVYLLIEPRLKFKYGQVHLSLYSFPQSTVDQLLFVDGMLGLNLNIFSESVLIGNENIYAGAHIAASLNDYTFYTAFKGDNSIISGNFFERIKNDNILNASLTPYVSSTFLSGRLHSQVKIEFTKLISSQWYNAFSMDVGYTTKI
ncbi:MAG: hypothetical protein K5829_12530 [Treponema sp.]|nr:hypothetical protein [Treponema sp.]